ncbi:MAG: helix-hairpin-helix domain-containing protein [Chitinophagaceae bacterium]|nr:helix-hairpin-helix domain-containing protein [Chitinophagaceae bacterium]
MNHYKNILLFTLLSVTLLPSLCFAQAPVVPPTTTEQQMEAVTENSEDNETEDDSFLQSMQQFLKSPINLNTADETTLKELVILKPQQIQNIISYRNLFGKFINLYELQAVPGLDIATIERLRAFVTVSMDADLINSLGERLSGGTHTFVARVTRVLERSKGYLLDPNASTNYYPGSPQRYFLRYKYQYKNLLQYGVVAEKDAGEDFFKGSQKQGFDFYSAHLFARNIGIIKSLAIGDFTVNMGQGLTQWQSLAFKKSADVINIKRQLPVLRPYNSAGEINFHRGLGITIAKNHLEATGFVSFRKLDANLSISLDTLNSDEFIISSLQTSGLHRTKNEVLDKGVQDQLAYGGNIAYNKNNLHIGANVIQYRFKLAIQKADDAYNVFALSGQNIGNQSIDYSYTFRNFHFFGEAAFDNKMNKAFVNGMQISVDANVDMSLLYRNISPRYQSLYTNAFTESTFPSNEKGIYAGISIRPTSQWRIDAYADFYKFPWLKYLVDAPTAGVDYLAQLTYKPNKQLEIYARYRTESKSKNYNPDGAFTSPVVPKPRQSFRSQLNYRINSTITFRNRVELVWFDRKGGGAQNGFLSFVDFVYKPMMKKYSGNVRLLYFETQGYDSRMYTYENDVLYSFSIPVFYDKGYRYYLNLNYDFSKRLSLWFRWAQTIYKDKTTVGTGLDEIQGNKKTEVKLQLQYYF